MFNLIGKKLLLISRAGDSTAKICFLQNPSLRYFSISINQASFTISYLTNSCGLSQINAVSASKKIQLKNSEGPDSVLTLLNNRGFTKTQITRIVFKFPRLLLARYVTLKPKFEFLQSVGFSSPELAILLSSNPEILRCSLKTQLIPRVDFLKSVDTDNNVIAIIKRTPRILRWNIHKFLIPNISVLRDHNVPEKRIAVLLKTQARSLLKKPDRFNEIVMDVVKMGFDPFKYSFSRAIYVITGLSKSSLEEKWEIYRRWGWSEKEILSAFKRQPVCMLLSEENITKTMDFLVNKTCWESSAIIRCPNVLLYNLEKRIIPRYSVLRVLISKGLIKKDLSLSTCLVTDNKNFLKYFVTKYQKEVPHLMDIYQGNASSLGLGSGSEQKDGMEKL